MSEHLLLSVFSKYLSDQGYQIERRVQMNSGLIDVLARISDRMLVAEVKWIRSEGDIYEAVGRCVQNKLAIPEGIPVLVLPIGETTAESRDRILGACYKHSIEVHYVDINNRAVYPDYITTQIYPAIHRMVNFGQCLLEQNLSGPQREILRSLITPFKIITKPPELIDDINSLLNQL